MAAPTDDGNVTFEQLGVDYLFDEAHSSQTGDSAASMKAVLGTGQEPNPDEPVNEAEDALAVAAAARGKQPNLSFFAFTATPKARTLELFGLFDPATGRYVPFHLYSMRQAIQEGFILDVLANYVTYETYWNIEQTIPDDPEFDPGKARRRSPSSSPCIRTSWRRRPR